MSSDPADENAEHVDYDGDANYNPNEAEAGLDVNGDGLIPNDGEDVPIIIPRGVIPHVLFVSRFQPSVTEEEIKATFERFGPVRSMVHKTTVAFIEFEKAEDAYKAKHALHRTPCLGTDSLVVDFKKNNTGVKNFASEEEFMEAPGGGSDRRDHRDRERRYDDRRREDRPPRSDSHTKHDYRPREEYRDDRQNNRGGDSAQGDRYRGGAPRDGPGGYAAPQGNGGYRPDDRRYPPNESMMYRERPSAPPNHGRSRSPPPYRRSPPRGGENYEDRRPQKRGYDGPAGPGAPPNDYRGNYGPPHLRVPVDSRGPPPNDYYPPRNGPPPRQPMGYNEQSLGPGPQGPGPKFSEPRRSIEPSSYAAGANRPRGEYDDNRRAVGGPPMMRYEHDMPPRMRDYPPAGPGGPPGGNGGGRREGPPPGDFLPSHRGGGAPYGAPIDRGDFRGGPPEDSYAQKRSRY
eukprot:gene8437-9303_t